MSSAARIEANRINALKSTGPRSAEGKQRSSLNAIKHGAFVRMKVLPGEDQAEFDQVSSALFQSLSPRSAMQEWLCGQIVEIAWKIKRLGNAELGIYQTRQQQLDEDRDEDDDTILPSETDPLVSEIISDDDGPITRVMEHQLRLNKMMLRMVNELYQLKKREEVGSPQSAVGSECAETNPVGSPQPAVGSENANPVGSPQSAVGSENAETNPTPPQVMEGAAVETDKEARMEEENRKLRKANSNAVSALLLQVRSRDTSFASWRRA